MKPVEVEDAAVLRAFANPVRLRLLDLLRAHGPATVGMLAERSDEAVGSVSHHVKFLAEAGLIEAAPGLARDRRERWWRACAAPRRWSRATLDPAGADAALSAEEITLEHDTAYARRVLHQHDPGWNSFASRAWLRLTPAELDELEREMTALIGRYDELSRRDPDRPGAEPVLVHARGMHVEP